MGPWFVARERFGPDSGGRWQSFLVRSGLTQLDELITLDLSLCPDAVGAPDAAYWAHRPDTELVLSGYLVTSLPFLLTKLSNGCPVNVLGLFHEEEARPMDAACGLRFALLGYDLVETNGSTSALSNCGGFPAAFDAAELTSVGLLATWQRALEVRRDLRRQYPDEPHAHCDIWGIHRALWPPGSCTPSPVRSMGEG